MSTQSSFREAPPLKAEFQRPSLPLLLPRSSSSDYAANTRATPLAPGDQQHSIFRRRLCATSSLHLLQEEVEEEQKPPPRPTKEVFEEAMVALTPELRAMWVVSVVSFFRRHRCGCRQSP